jgi:hypothetical protein
MRREEEERELTCRRFYLPEILGDRRGEVVEECGSR